MPDRPATGNPELQFLPQRPRWLGVAARVAAPVILFALLITIWQVWVVVADVKPFLLPTPIDAFGEAIENRSFLLSQTWVTLSEIAYGYLLAVAIGVPLAMAIANSRLIEISLFPLLVASQVVPKIALAPLFLIWLGFGIASKIVIVMLIAFFPIVVNGVVGLQSVEQEKIYLAQSMGASKFKTFYRVRLPTSLPSLFGGLKLAAILAVVGAVVGEFIGANKGLGRTLLVANGLLDTELLFATIGYLTVLGVGFYLIVDLIERLTIPWHISKRRST